MVGLMHNINCLKLSSFVCLFVLLQYCLSLILVDSILNDSFSLLQELPYHLEQLLDNNRLIRCLMDWEVFDRMYSDEFSIDLLHSWRQVRAPSFLFTVVKCTFVKSITRSCRHNSTRKHNSINIY